MRIDFDDNDLQPLISRVVRVGSRSFVKGSDWHQFLERDGDQPQ